MRQPLGRQRAHQRVDPVEPAAALGHDHRLERAGPVPRHLEVHRADLGQHRLGPGPIASVPRMMPGRIVPVIAHVLGQLRLQRRLQHRLGQPGQQAARAHQRHTLLVGAVHQLHRQLLQRRRRPLNHLRSTSGRVATRNVNRVSHYLSFPAGSVPSLPEVVTPLLLHTRSWADTNGLPLSCQAGVKGLRGFFWAVMLRQERAVSRSVLRLLSRPARSVVVDGTVAVSERRAARVLSGTV